MRVVCTFIILCLALPRLLHAGDVQFQMPSVEAFEGAAIELTLEIQNAADFTPPQAPEIKGATVRVLERGRQSMTSIVNGRVTNSSSVTYAIEITPDQVGTIMIPPISVRVDGKTYASPAQNVEVRKSEADDCLSAEIVGKPSDAYIGQSIEVTLSITIRPYRDRTYGQLNETQMWQLVDLQKSDWGIFDQALLELRQRNATPRTQQIIRGTETYFVYELSRRIWPPKTGTPEVGAVRIRMTYPLALKNVQNFFGDRQLSITQAKPLIATASVTGFTVLPIPTANRPASFSGAVGTFAMSVSAKPTTVGVGDPVTLTLTITDIGGGANMESLQPPLLAGDQVLAKDFRVPNEQLSGVVSGSSKKFTVTVRPLRAGTTDIHPLEFSFFDPQAKAFGTARSSPVPIIVTPANQLDLSKIISAEGGTRSTTDSPGTQLTEVSSGLVANLPISTALLSNESLMVGPALWVGLAAAPTLTLGAFAWRIHRRRHELDSGLARRSRARRAADDRIRTAEDAAGLASAVTGFVEDMTGKSPGTLTRGDLAQVLAKAGVDHTVRGQVAEFLAACDRARYAGNESSATTQAVQVATKVVAALDGARLAAQSGGKS